MASPAEKPVAQPAAALSIVALAGIPLVQPGDDIAALVLDGLAASGMALRRGDIVVIAQKIVSKAEGRAVRIDTVTPSPRAVELADQRRAGDRPAGARALDVRAGDGI